MAKFDEVDLAALNIAELIERSGRMRQSLRVLHDGIGKADKEGDERKAQRRRRTHARLRRLRMLNDNEIDRRVGKVIEDGE